MNDASRATLFLASAFLAFGVTLPYLPLWLEAVRGLNGFEIGLAVFGASLGRLATGPMFAAWADNRNGRQVAVMMALALVLAFGLLVIAEGAWLLIPLGFCAVTLLWSLFPLVESMLLLIDGKPSFGQGRAIGSASFVGGVFLGGWLKDAMGPAFIMPSVAFLNLFTLAIAFFVPKIEMGRIGESLSFAQRIQKGINLYRRPTFLLLLLSTGPLQATHAFYYGYSALIWERQGFSGSMISALWSTGVVFEIILMTTTPYWSRFVTPQRVILIGAIGAIIRWWGLAMAPGLATAFLLQSLHGLSFAATYLGGVLIINRDVAREDKTIALSLQAALTSGAFTGIAGIASGQLYDLYDVRGYYAMLGLACIGCIFAVLLLMRIAVRPKRSTPPRL